MSAQQDWGIGEYEIFAPALLPAAERLVARAAPMAGHRAIDLGSGSGNATLPLLATGATVTAVEPSLRLLGVTIERAKLAGYDVSPVHAGAESLPLPDGDADVIVSNFALIFCPEPEAAFSEAVRVLAPGGRLLYTAWLPTGPIAAIAQRIRAVITEAQGTQQQTAFVSSRSAVAPGAVLWHDPETFSHLIPGGADAISVEQAEVVFTAGSADEWFTEMELHHPAWLAAQQQLGTDQWEALRDELVGELGGSITPEGTLAVVSEYAIVEIHPKG